MTSSVHVDRGLVVIVVIFLALGTSSDTPSQFEEITLALQYQVVGGSLEGTSSSEVSGLGLRENDLCNIV